VQILQNDDERNNDKSERVIISESGDGVICESWLQSAYSSEYRSRWSAEQRQVPVAGIDSWSLAQVRDALLEAGVSPIAGIVVI